MLKLLQSLVDRFAIDHGTQTFIPHITLCTCWESIVTAKRAIDLLMNDRCIREVRGKLRDPFVGDGSIFHLTFGYDLLLCYQSQQCIAKANRYLSLSLQIQIPQWCHMSLLYKLGGVDEHESKQLIMNVLATGAQNIEFNFSQLMLVQGDAPIATQRDVAEWAIIHRWPLF